MLIEKENIIKYISELIEKSNYSDLQLANKLTLHRASIWSYRNKRANRIRKSTIKTILDGFGIEFNFSGENIKISENGQAEKPKIVENQENSDRITQYFLNEISRLNNKIDTKNQEINTLKTKLENNSPILPQLDPNRLQLQIKLDKTNPTFINITASYSKLLGYENPFELLGKSYHSVLHPEEVKRVSELEENQEKGGDDHVWRLIRKDGQTIYIRSRGTITKSGDNYFSTVDILNITKEEYLENLV